MSGTGGTDLDTVQRATEFLLGQDSSCEINDAITSGTDWTPDPNDGGPSNTNSDTGAELELKEAFFDNTEDVNNLGLMNGIDEESDSTSGSSIIEESKSLYFLNQLHFIMEVTDVYQFL
jgi:hypothetical protein